MKSKQYAVFLDQIKASIIESRYEAAKLVNRQKIALYYQIGAQLSFNIDAEGWGSGVITQLSNDLRIEFPELKGFSIQNLKNMRQFFEEYQSFAQDLLPEALYTISNPPSPLSEGGSEGEIAELLYLVGFSQHMLLIRKCKDWQQRIFYLTKSATNQWSYRVLEHHIESDLWGEKGTLPNNFAKALTPDLSATALNAFKDEYLLDFIRLREEDTEADLEQKLLANLRKFMLSLGDHFSLIGNQYRIVVGDDEFFIDLLFYHRALQCLVAMELKSGKFKPEYAGKMNFYLHALDDHAKLEHENPSIGIILCKEKNKSVVEYTFMDMNKAMGVATYKTTKRLPAKLRGHIPDAASLKKLL